MPADLTLLHVVAVVLLFGAWAAYAPLLALFRKGTLNSQLNAVRKRWIALSTGRDNRTFDAVLMGHIINSVAFFGSATLIVLAALGGVLAGVTQVYDAVSGLPFLDRMSVELFTLKLAVVAAALTNAFFSFTLALRKLLYTIALAGGLPEEGKEEDRRERMIDATATVLTEALKSFNNGIRGFYFSLAALCLFIGPWVCIGATLAVLALLLARQTVTRTARAIEGYVEALEDPMPGS